MYQHQIRQATGVPYIYGERNEVTLRTIVLHLSKLCRFSGATSEFYSVAQHSLLVEELMLGAHHAPALRYKALLHDAHEAFTTDIPTPLQDYLEEKAGAPIIHDLKAMIDEDIFSSLGVALPTDAEKKIIKIYDHEAFCIEARYMLPNPPDYVHEGSDRHRQIYPWEPMAAANFMYERLLYVGDEIDAENNRRRTA
jgi:hypothetical protein